MTERVSKGWLDLAAHAVGAPSFVAALVLYYFVTWVPDAIYKRDHMCAFLVLAGIGAGLIQARAYASSVRYTGAVAMVLGVVGVVFIGAW